MFIKICGITRLTDALHAVQQGADALGFVFWPRSPRYITPGRAAEIIAELPGPIEKVGVFVDESIESIQAAVARAGLTTVQLHGDEPPAYAAALGLPILRALRVEELAGTAWPPETTFLLDAIDPAARGGTGAVVDWAGAAVAARERRVVLAGGLTPENVGEAIARVRPFGVDVSSGVEETPGVKDFGKVTRFLANAKAAFEACQ